MALKVGFSGFGAAGRYLHAPLVRAAGMEVIGDLRVRARSARSHQVHEQSEIQWSGRGAPGAIT